MIKLAEATNDDQDLDALSEWISGYPRLTQGHLTKEYETKWSEYLGVKNSVSVNSGSSANLLMLYAMIEAGDLEPGDAVIVPALSWATDLAPVIQLGLTPILCDCNMNDFSLDLDHLDALLSKGVVFEEQNIRIKKRAKAVILVPVLGFVPDMEKVVSICDKHNVILLEDCCESLGSEYKGQKLGTFGVMSTFSTFFGHHISTIEGGMICVNDSKYHKILRSIRAHGWGRDWTLKQQEEARVHWEVSEFDSAFTFYTAGFNCRSTDLQAFLGIRQLNKLPAIVEKRNENYKKYLTLLGMPDELEGFYVSNFAFPVISTMREKLIEELIANGVECRPLICGSLGEQPVYVKRFGELKLPNASFIKKYGMYVPNHHLLSDGDIQKIAGIIKGSFYGRN
jgi:CDP-4-dehydro-6-deoxyglucose reductase, E1